jgi:PAS domain S-box-containing protein
MDGSSMSNVEELPRGNRRLTEYEALIASAPSTLDAIPGAVYVCDKDGRLVRYNAEAATFWGREPTLNDSNERFCGSHRLYLVNGTPLPHDECPMALAVMDGAAARNAEVVIERPDGSRLTALVNIRPLRDHRGQIQGAINCFQDISDRKRIEEEIRQKNKELEDFFENSAIGLHIVSGDGIILRANKAELELLGYAANEYVGRHIAEFHVDAPVIGDILHRLSSGEKLDRFPARLRAKDGSVKHVLITSNSRFDDGKFVNTRCFTTDVTSLHEAELARRDSEGRLAATYNAATVGIAESDETGTLLRVNDSCCKILGRSHEQLVGMRFLDYTHESDCERDMALYAQQVRGEIDNYSMRKRARKLNGELVYLDVFSSSVRDENGKFRYGVRVLQDVTDKQHMEEQIRQSEQKMRELLEALPAAVYTTDAEGRITYYNKAAVELAGRTPQIGDKWCVSWRLYWPDGSPLPLHECPMAITIKENRPVRDVEAVAERPDGTRVPFVPYPTPLRDANGKLIGAINMLVDISERKRAESQQKVLIDELNHRVKNTLATVQSLAAQTARHAESLSDFGPRFEARLVAMARAHDLLTKRYWQDAPLDALVHEVLAPLIVGATEQVRISGPAISLKPRAALSLTMALNELGTNAVKYGALSTDSGELSVDWQVAKEDDRPLIDLRWSERGGPPVTPPSRRGFGSRLMERCIEGDLGGNLDLAFEVSGVDCRMNIPVGGNVSNE